MRRLSRGLVGGFVAALGVSALGLIGAGPTGATAAAASATPTTVAAFVGTDQTLYTYGPSTTAAGVGGPLAPSGAPVAMTRDSAGNATVFFVGSNQALYDYCSAQGKPEPITGAIVPAGTILTATTVAGNPVAALFAGKKIVVESEIPYPCTPISSTLTANIAPPQPVAWQFADGIAAAGFADGSFAVLATATDGSVHELAWQPNIGWTDTAVVPAGGASARGIAAAPVPGAGPGADMFELFYADGQGQLWKTRLTLASGAAQPIPHPWTATSAVPAGATLAAAAGPLGIYVSYVDAGGEVRVASVDPATDSWQKTDMVSAPNTAPAGSSIAIGATASEIDVYCGNGGQQAGYNRFGINVAGPGVWLTESGKGLLDVNGSIAAG